MNINVPLYPILIMLWTGVLAWLVSANAKINTRFQRYVLKELKFCWSLVNANMLPMEVFASRLEDLSEFLIDSEDTDTTKLLVDIMKVIK